VCRIVVDNHDITNHSYGLESTALLMAAGKENLSIVLFLDVPRG
jgi:hypothetical protein